jgi:hypothetical protein
VDPVANQSGFPTFPLPETNVANPAATGKTFPRMSDPKVLTAAIAEEALRNDSVSNLSAFTSIEDGAAALLGRYRGWLDLDQLTSLSAPAAQALAQHEGKLWLRGLKDLSAEVADALAAHRGVIQCPALDRHQLLQCITDGDPSDELLVRVSFEYNRVSYDEYDIISRGMLAAVVQATERDFELELPNMPKHWTEYFPVSELKDAFSVVSEDPADIAAVRRIFGTDHLGNAGLIGEVLSVLREEWTTLDLEKARRFLQDPASLDLSEMQRVSAEAAAELARFAGDLDLGGLWGLLDEAATALASHQGSLDLSSLHSLSGPAAEALARHQGPLRLTGLQELSDAAADALAGCTSPLQLSRIATAAVERARQRRSI